MAGSLPDDELRELAHLWTSGEWWLECSWRTSVELFALFEGPLASVRELMYLRQLMPVLSTIPVSRMKEALGTGSEFALGSFSSMEARRLVSKAAELGLRMRSEGETRRACLPMSEGGCLLIEDEDLMERVVEKMIEQGVPVRGIEVD